MDNEILSLPRNKKFNKKVPQLQQFILSRRSAPDFTFKSNFTVGF